MTDLMGRYQGAKLLPVSGIPHFLLTQGLHVYKDSSAEHRRSKEPDQHKPTTDTTNSNPCRSLLAQLIERDTPILCPRKFRFRDFVNGIHDLVSFRLLHPCSPAIYRRNVFIRWWFRPDFFERLAELVLEATQLGLQCPTFFSMFGCQVEEVWQEVTGFI